MKYKKLNPYIKRAVIKATEDGYMPISAICKEFGITLYMYQKIIENSDIDYYKNKGHDYDIKFIKKVVNEYHNGWSQRSLAKYYGLGRCTVQRWCARYPNGIEV